MVDQENEPTNPESASGTSARQRAIEAYESARDRTTDTLGEAPLLALAGGLAAGALIAALLPRTESETRLLRPAARRVRDSANAAYKAARDTGKQRFGDMGFTREKGEEQFRTFLDGLKGTVKASADAAIDAVRKG